jgi:hypothetical protein
MCAPVPTSASSTYHAAVHRSVSLVALPSSLSTYRYALLLSMLALASPPVQP